MKEWIANHNGCQIRVTNSWFGAANLYIDGDCRDTSNDKLVSSHLPALRARVTPANGQSFMVEVYVKGFVTVKTKNLCGRQINRRRRVLAFMPNGELIEPSEKGSRRE